MEDMFARRFEVIVQDNGLIVVQSVYTAAVDADPEFSLVGAFKDARELCVYASEIFRPATPTEKAYREEWKHAFRKSPEVDD